MPNTINIRLPESERIRFRNWTNSLSKENEAKCKNLVARSGEMMKRFAAMQAPVDKGFLRRGLHVQYGNDGLGLKFSNAVLYAPYMEWGTGKYVKVMSGYEDLAMTFKGRGIRRVNIHPKPYFFGSYEKVYRAFIRELHNMGFQEKGKEK